MRLFQAKMRELVSVQSAKEDVDNASTIRRMKKLLPSVRALRNQFEPSKITTAEDIKTATPGNKVESAAPRKWKSTSNFQTAIKDPSAASSKTAMLLERASTTIAASNRNRCNSLGSLTDEAMSSSSASSCSNGIQQQQQQQPAAVADYNVSTVSILQQLPDKDSKDFDMYRPRHSTAQWDPVIMFASFSIQWIIYNNNKTDGPLGGPIQNPAASGGKE